MKRGDFLLQVMPHPIYSATHKQKNPDVISTVTTHTNTIAAYILGCVKRGMH